MYNANIVRSFFGGNFMIHVTCTRIVALGVGAAGPVHALPKPQIQHDHSKVPMNPPFLRSDRKMWSVTAL